MEAGLPLDINGENIEQWKRIHDRLAAELAVYRTLPPTVGQPTVIIMLEDGLRKIAEGIARLNKK